MPSPRGRKMAKPWQSSNHLQLFFAPFQILPFLAILVAKSCQVTRFWLIKNKRNSDRKADLFLIGKIFLLTKKRQRSGKKYVPSFLIWEQMCENVICIEVEALLKSKVVRYTSLRTKIHYSRLVEQKYEKGLILHSNLELPCQLRDCLPTHSNYMK